MTYNGLSQSGFPLETDCLQPADLILVELSLTESRTLVMDPTSDASVMGVIPWSSITVAVFLPVSDKRREALLPEGGEARTSAAVKTKLLQPLASFRAQAVSREYFPLGISPAPQFGLSWNEAVTVSLAVRCQLAIEPLPFAGVPRMPYEPGLLQLPYSARIQRMGPVFCPLGVNPGGKFLVRFPDDRYVAIPLKLLVSEQCPEHLIPCLSWPVEGKSYFSK